MSKKKLSQYSVKAGKKDSQKGKWKIISQLLPQFFHQVFELVQCLQRLQSFAEASSPAVPAAKVMSLSDDNQKKGCL